MGTSANVPLKMLDITVANASNTPAPNMQLRSKGTPSKDVDPASVSDFRMSAADRPKALRARVPPKSGEKSDKDVHSFLVTQVVGHFDVTATRFSAPC